MIHELRVPLPIVHHASGRKGLAYFLIDYHVDHHLMWVCFMDNGECWTYQNPEIRLCENITMQRTYGE